MIPSPVGSTPFSVKDILNLEQNHIGSLGEKNESRNMFELCGSNNANGKIFSCADAGLGQLTGKISNSENHYENVFSENLQSISSQSSADLNSENCDKSDQAWITFDNMAASTSSRQHGQHATSNVIAEDDQIPKETIEHSSLQAAASTLINFSQHLHSQSYNSIQKPPIQIEDGMYGDYYLSADSYADINNHRARKEESFHDERQINDSANQAPQHPYDDLLSKTTPEYNSHRSNDNTLVNLQPSNQTEESCTFGITSSQPSAMFPKGVAKTTSAYHNNFATFDEKQSDYTENQFDAPPTIPDCAAEELVDFASSSSRSPLDSELNHHSDIRTSPIHPGEQELHHEDLTAHVTGKFTVTTLILIFV